jgi:stage V sporulation protein K
VQKQQIITNYRNGHIALSEALQLMSGEQDTITTQTEGMSREQLLRILSELDDLIGLEDVKSVVREIFSLIYMQQRRKNLNLKTESVVLHMVFKGNPGTGKTTIARLLAKMFHESGLLEKGHLVEVERADLVGEYIGHTAQKTREAIKKALGGVLFIDEAYSLARGGEKDFGRESIDALVKGMEDYRAQFVAIIAGYEAEMDWFLSTNPGLPSRFPIHINFPDYDTRALLEIARRTAHGKQYTISPEADRKLRSTLQGMRTIHGGTAFSNARFVRNLIEEAIRRHATRLFDTPHLSREQAMSLHADDFRWEGMPL